MRSAILALALVGCGTSSQVGSSSTTAARATEPAAAESGQASQKAPTVAVRGVRRGQALHVQVVARAESRAPGTAFERPRQWMVEATSGGLELDRIVNGSTRVTRLGTRDANRWDVTVTFDASFRLPGAIKRSELLVTPPGATPTRFVIAGL